MRNIIIPNKELRLLANQLQNFSAGYTVSQIRSLDKVIRIMNEKSEPFTEGLEKIVNITSDQSPEDKAKKQNEIDDYLKKEGTKKITCAFDNEDFEFIKSTWLRIASFSGQEEARESILIIDEAINKSSEPVFNKDKLVN
jgi:hypothetical protein